MIQRIKEKYDIIIYGATLTGIVAAKIFKEKGKKVIIVNHYGFPGGSLTESLNCYQEIDIPKLSPVTRGIYNKIAHENNGVIDYGGNGHFIDPEICKYVLLNEAIDSGVNLLFHTKAKAIIKEGTNSISLELVGKEGLIYIGCDKIIDCSDDKYLLVLSDHTEFIINRFRYNFIVNDKKKILGQSDISLRKILDIGNGRRWVSCECLFDKSANVEQEAQELCDIYSGKLQQFDSNIQVLPPQAELLFNVIPGSENNILTQYKSEEIFTKSSDLEKGIRLEDYVL